MECSKIQPYLSELASENSELPTEIAEHLAHCDHCQQQWSTDLNLLKELGQLDTLQDPGELFFAAQKHSVLKKLSQNKEQEALLHPELQEIIHELEELPMAMASEDFFNQQRYSIQAALEEETQKAEQTAAESELYLSAGNISGKDESRIQGLCHQLKELKDKEAGDLFFHRQTKSILKQMQVGSVRPAKAQRHWFKPMAVAAVLFFVMLGISRLTHWQAERPHDDWNMALSYLAEVEGDTESPLDSIDELTPQQLDRLASNLESSIYREADDDLLGDEIINPDDLNDQELNLLIKKLEAKVRT